MNQVTALLRLEGLAVLLAATWAYFAYVAGAWPVFAVLLLVPDLSMVGYLRGAAWGARTYNLVHNEALAIAVIAAGLALGPMITGAGLILGAHVGMDRLCGFGLKFPGAFRDTHLQRLEDAPRG